MAKTQKSAPVPSPQLGAVEFAPNMFDRTFSYIGSIDMARVKAIFDGGASGILYDILDLYNEIESLDARVKGLLATRYYTVTKQSYNVTAPDDSNAAAVEAADFVRDNIQRLKWKKVLEAILRGRTYGVSICEKRFEKYPDGKIRVADVVRLPDSKIMFNAGQRDVNRYGEYLLRKEAADWVWANDYPGKLIISQEKDVNGMQDYNGCMRQVARLFVMKTFFMKSYAQYAEKTGQPVQIVKMAKEDYKENATPVTNLLKSVGANRYGIMFEGMDYQIETMADTANVDIFLRGIELFNTEMAIAINGQNLTSDVKGGSYAAAAAHKEILSDRALSDIEFLDEIVNDQFVHHLVALNFPDLPFELYPTYSTILPESVNIDIESRGLREASKLIPIPAAFLYERLGIPQPADDEATIGGFSNSVLDSI